MMRWLVLVLSLALLLGLAGAPVPAQAQSTTLTVNSDLFHLINRQRGPAFDGDCDNNLPNDQRSILLSPPPDACTLGGALRQLAELDGLHTIRFSVPVVQGAGVIAEFTKGGSVTIQGPVTIDVRTTDALNQLANASNTAIHVKDIKGLVVKDVWIKANGPGNSIGIAMSGNIPPTTDFPCEFDNVVITGVTEPFQIRTGHSCDITNSRFGIDPNGKVVANSGRVVLPTQDNYQILNNIFSNGLTVVGDNGSIKDNKIVANAVSISGIPVVGSGVQIKGNNNVLEGNVIGADGRGGSFLLGGALTVIDGDENSVLNNRIGTTADGTAAAVSGATTHGMIVSGSGNCIGSRRDRFSGCTPLAPTYRPDGNANVISGNGGHGIIVTGGNGNVIQHNIIGLNLSQTAVLRNNQDGILLTNDPNQVGDLLAGDTNNNTIRGNVISGNGEGIRLDPNSNNNSIEGNFIGANGAGNQGLGNLAGAVFIRGGSGNVVGGSSGTTTGGPCTGSCNLISGNGGDGVTIAEAGGNNNKVTGNFIGTDVTGTVAIPNDHTKAASLGVSSNGVFLIFGARDNIIGGPTDTDREANLISGNKENGVHVNGSNTSGNIVQGNRIGTDITGTLPLGNGIDGVHIHDAPNNIIGPKTGPFGIPIGQGNLISGNKDNGVRIHAGATGNIVRGNFIGTDATGAKAVANFGGIRIDDAPNNVVGGSGIFLPSKTCSGMCNLISGNNVNGGVAIVGSSTKTLVQGNFIGTDVNGTAAVPNSPGGVFVLGAANTIGGASSLDRNIISGNAGSGVVIRSREATDNVVEGNFIGTDVNGTIALGNEGSGVVLEAAASSNIIGPSADPVFGIFLVGERNVISGNKGAGVFIVARANNNRVRANFIGVDVSGVGPLGNLLGGVIIEEGSRDNVIGGAPSLDLSGGEDAFGNVIAHNRSDGVVIEDTLGTGNTVLRNSIFSNGGLGIDLGAVGVSLNQPDSLPDFPFLTFIGSDRSTIGGRLNSTANTEFIIELFTSPTCDPSNHGEGKSFLRSLAVTSVTNGEAVFSTKAFFQALRPGHFVTATATDPINGTSEFSRCLIVPSGSSVQLGSISGIITLQGRTASFPQEIGHSLALVRVTPGNGVVRVNQSGEFSFVNVLAGNYTLIATAAGYVSAQRTDVAVEEAKSVTVPSVQLRCGLVNNDSFVNIDDITAMVDSFGTTPQARVDARGRFVDQNGDGVVNIDDISCVVSSFGLTSPQPWP